MYFYTLENRVEEMQGKTASGIITTDIDLEKVTRGQAVLHGIEVSVELLFYGILASIALYEIGKGRRERKWGEQVVTELEAQSREV